MKKLVITGLFASAPLFVSIAQAQTLPICPTTPVTYIGPLFGSGPVTSQSQIAVAIRQYITDGVWDFPAENFIVSGSQITADAPGTRVFSSSVPNHLGIFGPIAAGQYTMTITPIATNVTPNAPCPPLTFPLTVVQAYEYVPVPAPTGPLAALLAGLFGLAGVLGLRRIGSR